MKNNRERRLVGNPEDMMGLKVIEILDIYELNQTETYTEVALYSVLPKK